MQVDFNFIKNFMVPHSEVINSFLNIITVILIIIKKINFVSFNPDLIWVKREIGLELGGLC